MMGSRALLALAGCVLAGNVLGAVPQTPEGCASYKWDVSHEVAVYRQAPRALTAGISLATAPELVPEQLHALTLAAQEQVSYAAAPGKKTLTDGAYGGVLRLRVAVAGKYRVAIDSGFWLDIVQGTQTLPSIDFNGSQSCAGPHKIVVYELPANTDLVLQVSAADSSEAHLSVTPVP